MMITMMMIFMRWRLRMNKTLNQKDIKVLGLSSLGGTLEFYDFMILLFLYFLQIIFQQTFFQKI